MNRKNILITTIIAAAVATLWSGCGGIGALGGIASSETPSEKETAAEFKLKPTEGKIVVFVAQPGWIKSPMDLRVSLTNAVNLSLEKNVEIKKERLFEYMDIMKFRLALPETMRNDPFETASKLYAQYVLVVSVQDFDLSTFGEKDLYNGTMTVKTNLYDINKNRLWPTDKNSKEITVSFEGEKGTVKSAVKMLSDSAAFCITRYFYNCKTERFHISEEKREIDSEKW
jgi:hypothetical protein